MSLIHRLAVAALAVLLLLGQHLPVFAEQSPDAEVRILLCTSSGLQWVVVDESPDEIHVQTSCPWCRLEDDSQATVELLWHDDFSGGGPWEDADDDGIHGYSHWFSPISEYLHVEMGPLILESRTRTSARPWSRATAVILQVRQPRAPPVRA